MGDFCVSGGAQVYFAGVGTILGGVIVWLAKHYIDYLIDTAEGWRQMAQRGTGLAEDLSEVAKKRR